jgi:fructokinase
MIVVAGEALVDLVPDSSGALRVHYGGGPFNTARWLARLGQPVSFLGTFSDDPFGQQLRGALVQDGVGLELADRTALPTTLALAQLDDSGSASYRFYTEREALVMFDPNIRASLTADRDRYLDRFWRALRHTDVLKVSVEDLRWLIPDLPLSPPHEN